MYLCSANQVLLQDTIVRNFKGKLLVKRWNDMGTIVFDNFLSAKVLKVRSTS